MKPICNALRAPMALALGSVALATTLSAGEPVQNLAKELVELRSEVEALHAKLDDKKDSVKAKLKSLQMQTAEIEANIRREDTRLKQLQNNIDKVREENRAKSEKSTVYKPMVLSTVDALKAHISKGMPFKRNERLAALGEIKTQLLSDVISPEKAINRVWSFLEDEMRLTRENGIFKETVMISGEPRLADVARLGMVMMYYKTSDGKTGYIRKSGNDWSYEPAKNELEGEQIAYLFDSLKKQIRTGFFTIPNTLPAMEVR